MSGKPLLGDRVLTAADVIALDPCWIEDDGDARGPGHRRIRSLCPVSLADVADMRKLRGVTARDRVWLLARCVPESTSRLFAVALASRALRLDGCTDEHVWEAVRVAREYACGKATICDLRSARRAARRQRESVTESMRVALAAAGEPPAPAGSWAAKAAGAWALSEARHAREELKWQLRWWRRALRETEAEA